MILKKYLLALIVLVSVIGASGTVVASYCDPDGDGYNSVYLCHGNDCDDSDPAINPGATEICDGIDNNCNAQVDEGVLTTYYADADGDGYGDPASAPVEDCTAPSSSYVDNAGDCDDTSATTYPGAEELADGIDNDCDTGIDEGLTADPCDVDEDGYQTNVASTDCDGTGTDCNDADDSVHPGASESCDEVDNNCDGTVDEGVQITSYVDVDGDGYGDWHRYVRACTTTTGYVTNDDDCDDGDAAISPAAAEICGNSVDENCSGGFDDGCGDDFCDRDGDGALNAYCTSANIDCDDNDSSRFPGNSEVCDEIDNDCNGTVDDGLATVTSYRDADGDGYGGTSASTVWCAAPEGFVDNATDCDDGAAGVNPGVSIDDCGGVDDDCDGVIDEDCVVTVCDADGDGFDSSVGSCGGTDCDDSDPLINPSAPSDVGDGVDNDCDGVVDEDATTTVCDADGDGYDTNVVSADCDGSGTDCDDSNARVNPDAIEVCDFVDNNCDGVIDTDAVDAATVYADRDGDGFGNPAVSRVTCARMAGFVVNALDCDDHKPLVNPAVDEVCGDGVDNNCNGIVDGPDAIDALRWYADSDGDGYGDSADLVLNCTQPDGYISLALDCDDTDDDINPLADEDCGDGVDNDCNAIAEESCHLDSDDNDGDGYTEYQGDCDDYNDRRYPGAPEVCDGLDNDCDGLYDDEDSDLDVSSATFWYEDDDLDGFGEEHTYIKACQQPAVNYVLYETDCNDTNDNVFPGADEVCGDGIDNDCDGTDDVCPVVEVTGETEPSVSAELEGGSSACSLNALSTTATGGSGLAVFLLALLVLRVFRFKK